MDEATRERAKTIDARTLGPRLRSARLRAGLTQAGATDGIVSTAYYSRLESGQRRPDPDVLVALCERLSLPLAQALAPEGPAPATVEQQAWEARLDVARLELAGGNAAEALRRAGELAEDPLSHERTNGARLTVLVGLAQEASGDLTKAIAELVSVNPGDLPALEWLRAATGLCRCYRETGAFDRAIAVATAADAFIEERALDALDEAIAVRLTGVAAHHQAGNVELATRECARVLAIAEEVGSPSAKASAYWNASIIAHFGDDPSAVPLAQKALTLMELDSDNRRLAVLRTQLGVLELEGDPPQPEQALATLSRAQRELEWSAATAVEIARNRVQQARAHAMLGDTGRATAVLDDVLATAPEDALLLRAQALTSAGRIAFAAGENEAAVERFRLAVAALTGLGADRGAAQAWYELAEQLEAVGDAVGALDAFKRSAASMGVRTKTRAVAPSR